MWHYVQSTLQQSSAQQFTLEMAYLPVSGLLIDSLSAHLRLYWRVQCEWVAQSLNNKPCLGLQSMRIGYYDTC